MIDRAEWAEALLQEPMPIVDGRKCPYCATPFREGELAIEVDGPDTLVMHRACIRAMAGEAVILPNEAGYEPDL